jgi:protoheme IX farnesyltransferase
MDTYADHAPSAVRGIDRLRAFADLSKPRISLLLVIVAAASFLMADRGSPSWLRLAAAAVGTGILAAGIFALNQYMERISDGLMRRTAGRPLPSGRLTPGAALVFGIVMTTASVAFFFVLFGWVSAAVAFATFVSYILVYTPLKKRTALHTTLGAISGAMPPLLGWASARGSLAPDAWALFAIMFFWQYPHFLAIDSIYAEDYARAGIRLMPAVDARGGRGTTAVIVLTLVLLTGASILPRMTGLAGNVYLVTALAAAAAFLAAGILLAIRRTKKSARIVLRASVLYLPVVFIVMAFAPGA